jgi:CRISPR associated protein Cas1
LRPFNPGRRDRQAQAAQTPGAVASTTLNHLVASWRHCGAQPSPRPCHLAFAYAALKSEIRIKAISDGYDPTIGIMHEGSDGSSKFIFDLMEPGRPKVDRAVLEFVRGHAFDRADFVIRADGVCRLNPEMARTVVTMLWT